MNLIQRDDCVICGNKNLQLIHSIERVPVYMGTTLDSENFLFSNLDYNICDQCKTLQLSKLIPLDILYQKSHNIDVVGKIWEEHNHEFMKFVGKNNVKKIMEIGDPSYKMIKSSRGIFNFDKWFIIEPNAPKEYPADVEYINSIFDDKFEFEEKVDAFILSHSFEHMYDPYQVLKNILNILKYNGYIFISIPNMKYICDEKIMPPAGMHFEHSFYVDHENIKILLDRVDLTISETYFYKNHSIFLKCQLGKCETKLEDIVGYNNFNIFNFQDFLKKCQQIVDKINKNMLNYNHIYMYGAHFPAQLLMSMGLNMNKIVGILDNSQSKVNQFLYGTNLKVYSPKYLEGKEKISVICEMGVYTKEIKQNLLNINSKVNFL